MTNPTTPWVVGLLACLLGGAGLWRPDAAHGLECTTPCGAEELVSCAAKKAGLTPERYWGTILFSTGLLDKWCAKAPKTPRPADKHDPTDLQVEYATQFCANTGAYYSYANFLAAVRAVQAAMGPDFTFLCAPGTTTERRYKELANFLTTMAQETTSTTANYTNDGLYFRWEYGALAACFERLRADGNYDPASKRWCNDWTDAGGNEHSYKELYTSYTPSYGYKVAVDAVGKVWTKWAWNAVGPTGGNRMILNVSPNQQVWDTTPAAPAGYTLVNLVDTNVARGYWVGMGPKQLTGVTMVYFFGWYHNFLVAPAVEAADLNAFIERFANDGALGFAGGLWYWMYRVSGAGAPTISAILADPGKPPCHDIAIVTRLVNGGCNNYNSGTLEKPTERVKYYRYFLETCFGQKLVPDTSVVYKGAPLNSMECMRATDTAFSNALQEYCLSTPTGTPTATPRTTPTPTPAR